MVFAGFLLLGSVSPGFAQTSQAALENLAERISEKRAKLEQLSNQIEQEKQQYNEELRSLQTQIGDVKVQINRQQTRLSEIRADIAEVRREMQASRTSVEEVRPLVARTLTRLKTYIKNGLPFQVSERISEVETLERLLQEGNLETRTILTRVWNMIESEFRMTTESGIYRQTIRLNGEEQLAEVARLGTVFLYFKTFDDRYGYAVPANGGTEWTYRLAEDRAERERIVTLFDSLRKNLRQGFYTIPNPYADQG
jgi:septal ring factor EnvC (AmiA/AmiB activator)